MARTTRSETARRSRTSARTNRGMYVDGNTVRLDKLQKTTGLDLRMFDDAITFKIALMVVKYMKYMESKDTY